MKVGAMLEPRGHTQHNIERQDLEKISRFLMNFRKYLSSSPTPYLNENLRRTPTQGLDYFNNFDFPIVVQFHVYPQLYKKHGN